MIDDRIGSSHRDTEVDELVAILAVLTIPMHMNEFQYRESFTPMLAIMCHVVQQVEYFALRLIYK